MKIFVLLSALVFVAYSKPTMDASYFSKYEGYSVFQLYPESYIHVQILTDLYKSYPQDLDFWTEIRGENKPVNIMIAAEKQAFFKNMFDSISINYKVVIPNVADLMKTQTDYESQVGDFDYSKYHTLDEINGWIDQIAQQYLKFVTVINVTTSYEGRNIRAIKISVPSKAKKPAIWYDGGIHAREWISPATVIYIGYSLLSKYGNDANVTQLLNTFDFYILPVFNVDGYAYTWTKDRMWRKTRSKTIIPTCYGADPNRNWDYHWCEGGASKDPCSDSYCGSKPFSEPEVKGVANFLGSNNDTILCYINFHSFSQLWMSPWGYTDKKPDNYTLQDNGSIQAVTALASLYGTQYDHGNIAQTIYIASGSSVDWTYGTANIFFSYAVELRDQGQYGFLLPEDQIIPSGMETFEAIKALSFYIKSQI